MQRDNNNKWKGQVWKWNGENVERISKAESKRIYNSGGVILMQSSNFHPDGVGSKAIDTNPNDHNEQSFEHRCYDFRYYNCCRERGLYTHFYKKCV